MTSPLIVSGCQGQAASEDAAVDAIAENYGVTPPMDAQPDRNCDP